MEYTDEQIETAARAGWEAVGRSFNPHPSRVETPWEEAMAGERGQAINAVRRMVDGVGPDDASIPPAFVSAAKQSLAGAP